jgi:hypothetical protein
MNDLKRIAAFRIYNSGLLNEFSSVTDCIEKHFGFQAQMKQIPFLAIALRTNDVTLNYMNSLIQDERKIVRLWGIRNTLHYYSVDDWGLLCSYLKKNPSWFERRMRKANIDYDRLYRCVERILEKSDYINRDILMQNGIEKEYIGPWGDIFIDLNNNGLICNNSKNSREAYYANRLYWCPDLLFEWKTYDRALKEIILRYFRCYGPATIDDLLHWLGMPNTKTNYKSIFHICESLSEIIKYDDTLWGEAKQYEQYRSFDYKEILNENTFFLGKFDPLLLAYDDKSWIVDEEKKIYIWRKAGHVSSVVLLEGKAYATWNFKIEKKKITISIYKFIECFIEINKIRRPIYKIAKLFGVDTVRCIIRNVNGTQEIFYL